MDRIPTADDVRAELQALDALDRKVVGGLVALCMTLPHKVRDREWLAERFVHVATVAHGFDGEDGAATDDDVARVRLYAQLRFEAVARATLRLFVRVGDDLQRRGGAPDFATAQALVAGYLGSA